MTKLIEITIPVLDEEKTLTEQIGKILNFIETSLKGYPPIHLVIADNGSTDRTPEIAESLKHQYKNLRYVRLEERGVGRALKASWLGSNADIVGYMDLDLATDMKHLPYALDSLLRGNSKIATGSRLAKGAKVLGRSPLRGITSRVFNSIVKLYFDTSFSDGMCGFKFIHREILEPVMQNGAVSDGWFFATELLICSEYLGYEITDIPVEWTDDPDSKVRLVRLTLEYLKAMKALKRALPKNKSVD